MTYNLQIFVDVNKAIRNVLDIKNPVAVIVGGTSGIGEYTAYTFAKYTEAPSFYIVGRSEESGKRVLDRLKELNRNPSSKFRFIKCDTGLIKENDRLCSIISRNESKVNLLVSSAGYLSFEGYIENSEGLNKKLAVHCYGRWRVVQGLIPLLSEAAKLKEPARTIVVHGAGREGNIFKNDLDLKESRWLSALQQCNN
jgi:short-subunit dehydrogenase